jgi:NAD(P)-dependent dehydrogenase (short-subunit alcohol dehydrogenase family)
MMLSDDIHIYVLIVTKPTPLYSIILPHHILSCYPLTCMRVDQNMAKAALNMMTLTGARDYARDGILMNSADTGELCVCVCVCMCVYVVQYSVIY